MKISKVTRERAAVLCSMGACNEILVSTACHRMGIKRPRNSLARNLALSALTQAILRGARLGITRYAEAEALLRTGWSP